MKYSQYISHFYFFARKHFLTFLNSKIPLFFFSIFFFFLLNDLAKGDKDTPPKKKSSNKLQQRGRPVPAKRAQNSPNDNRPKKRARIEKGF